jgi:hypothetical protein
MALLAPPTLAAVWFGASGGLNAAMLIAAAGIGLVNAATLWRLNMVTDRFRVGWWGTSAVIVPPAAAALLGLVAADTVGPLAAMASSMVLLTVLLLLAKPFAPEELRLASRGIGPLAGRAMGPFVRRPAV